MADPAETSGLQADPTLSSAADETLVIPVVAETARIERREAETGRVRVSTHTETVEQVLRERLSIGRVDVARVPVDRTLAEGEPVPAIREEGGVTIIPILEEILVVEKRLVLKEEVHVRRTLADEDVEVPVTLRRQRAVVERLSPDGHVAERSEPQSPEETVP